MPDDVRQLKFKCPNCGETKLECVENDVCATSVIENISEDGDFDYGEPTLEGGEVSCFQCASCGCGLGNAQYGYTITKNEEVVDWCRKNCEQE